MVDALFMFLITLLENIDVTMVSDTSCVQVTPYINVCNCHCLIFPRKYAIIMIHCAAHDGRLK